MSRVRLDSEMVRRGLAEDVISASEMISSHLVSVDGAVALKPETLVKVGTQIEVLRAKPYVSRGGEKLAGALTDLRVDVAGRRCCDVGAGSGGFTDALLKAGASSVCAIDVGYGQFDWKLRNDSRVTLFERTNVRQVVPDQVGGPFQVVVADLSFVSLSSLATPISALAGPEADVLLMVKPQFEAPREDVGPGGIVLDPQVWRSAVNSVVQAFLLEGFVHEGSAAARIRGTHGNQEFFVHLSRR